MSEKDLYRDTPVRYLGYANEVGEAFRSIVGKTWVLASYGVATAYVFADTYDKSTKMYNKTKDVKKSLFASADTLIWQTLASVAIPGFTINRVCALSNYLLKKSEVLPKSKRKWVVTGIGLSTIPFIIKPIDHSVDVLLDYTLRKFEP